MEETAWRYGPEFMIKALINGVTAGNAIEVFPSPSSAAILKSYGLLIKPIAGGAMAYVRQRPSGVNWVPSVSLNNVIRLSFWMAVRRNANNNLPDFFGQVSTQRFGRQIVYTNNLSAAGDIDSNLAGNVVSLTAAVAAGNPERGSLATPLLSTAIKPGDYNTVRAGKIKAGAPVSFTLSTPLTATQASVALDFREQEKAAYLLRLEGATPVQERVVIDREMAQADAQGMIDIFKDSWLLPAQPREYRINFLST